MSEKHVQEADLAKAIAALQTISKGHSSRGTVTTEVESMRDGSVGAGSGAGATQVFHTADNSDRAGWAGSSWDGVADNGPGVDSVKEDGTDYASQGKVMKSILDKLAKGQALTAAEFSILKGSMKGDDDKDDMDKGLPPQFAKKGDKEEKPPVAKSKDRDADDEEDMGKSLADFASEDESVSKGLEVSEFLAGFAGVVAKSLQASEQRIISQVTRALLSEADSNGDFQKSLAEAVVALGESVAAVAQRQEQLETAPARGARSIQNVQAIEKGGYAGPADEPLNKSVVAGVLVDLVSKGEATVGDVIKFETNGQLSESLQARVRTAIGR